MIITFCWKKCYSLNIVIKRKQTISWWNILKISTFLSCIRELGGDYMISVCLDEISTLSSRDRFYLMITWGSLFRQSGTNFQLIIFYIYLDFLNNPLQACAKLLFHGTTTWENFVAAVRKGGPTLLVQNVSHVIAV